MMNKKELLAMYDQEIRIALRLPELVYETTGRIVRDYSLAEGSGFIDYASLDEACADAEIDAQVAFFKSLGMPFTWKVYDHDRPTDLRQRLAARRFKNEAPDALMMLDIQDAPPFYWSMDPPEFIKPVVDPAGIGEIVRLEEEVWHGPRDWLRDRLVHILETTPDRLSLYAVTQDGRTAAAAWTYFYPHSPIASLLGGSTLPGYRMRGFYTALVVTRVREARQRGYQFLAVDASSMSAPILEKLGFQKLESAAYCRWSPAA